MDGRAATTAADTRRRTVCLLYRCLRPPLNSLLAPCCSHGRRQNAAGPAADTVDGRAATTAADARRWTACLLYCCLRPCCWHPAARLYCCLRPCCWHPAARTAAVRMLLASLLTPWTDVLLLLRCWHSPLGSLLAVSLPSAGCWHPAARTAAAGLVAGTLLLAPLPECCWPRC